MKNTFSLILVIITGFSNGFTQQYDWIDLSANIPDSNYIQRSLRDVYFIGQEGWITGHFESELRVWHTTDGGNTFTIQAVPPNSGNGMSIFMRSLQEGYLVTNSGHLLRTADGGNNWTTIATGGGLLYSVSFPPLPESTGYICGGFGGKVCNVTGSLVNVEFTTPATLTSIVCPVNSDEGWVCGGTLIRHRNSTGWVIGDQNYSASNSYNAIHFIDNQHGWAVGFSGARQSVIIYTVNGLDWLGVSNAFTANLNDVYFLNTQEGWAVGNNIILHSTDGGLTWVQEATAFLDSSLLMSVFAVSSHEVYVVGNRANKSLFLKYTLITDTEENPEQVNSILYQNQPNPFRESTVIRWQIPAYNQVVLKIYDFAGREVKTLIDCEQAKGKHEVIFDATGLPAGVYSYQLSVNGIIETKKMILVQ